MTTFTQSQVKRLTAVHGWSGVILGLALYAVVITGTVIVFKHDIAVWSVGGQTSKAALAGNIDAKVRSLIESMSKGYQKRIFILPDDRGDLLVFPHARVFNPDLGQPDSYGSLFRLDPITGETLARHEGFVFREARTHETSALEDFFYDLHERLHVPGTLGLILVGVLGLLAMFGGLSGLIMHRHLIRDIFVPERWGGRIVSFRDRHLLAGTWSLPFAFLLGFTGAFLCFTGTVVSPLLTEVAFGGNDELRQKVLAEPVVELDPSSAVVTNLDSVVADATDRSFGVPPRVLFIERWGRADVRIRTFHDPSPGSLSLVRTLYHGVTGEFLGYRAPVGNAPSVGGTLRGLMGPLHFGNFGGVLSKAVWVGLGAAMAYVVISGLRLWVRRREEELLWRRFGRAVTVVGYGLPVAMLACAYAFFFALGAGADEFWWTPAGFLIGIVPGVVPGFIARDEEALRRFYRGVLGFGILLLPVVRMATGGLDWASAISGGQGTVLSVDLTLFALGAGLIWWARRPRTIIAPQPEPAE